MVALRRLGESLAGVIVLSTLVGVLVAPLAVAGVLGLLVVTAALTMGAPTLTDAVGAVFSREVHPRRAQRAIHVLYGAAGVSVALALGSAVAGLAWVTGHVHDTARIGAALPQVLGACGYALAMGAAALGAAIDLRRRLP